MLRSPKGAKASRPLVSMTFFGEGGGRGIHFLQALKFKDHNSIGCKLQERTEAHLHPQKSRCQYKSYLLAGVFLVIQKQRFSRFKYKTTIRLNTSKDLAEITDLAQDRKSWRRLASQIEKAAEVSQTQNWDAKGQ